MDGLLDAAQRAVKAAMDAGAEFADAYCSRVREISVGVENTSLRECEVVRDYGIGVRAFCHGGMGLASAQSLEYDDAVECGQRAAEMARAADADPDFVSLPQPAEPPQVTQLYDDTLAGLAEEGRIILRYCDEVGEITAGSNPNGSRDNIAGICNEGFNVFGLMPHPERASEGILGSTDGLLIWESVMAHYRAGR